MQFKWQCDQADIDCVKMFVDPHSANDSLLESSLREKGGLFEGAYTFGPHAVRDGNFITGQNPEYVDAVFALFMEVIKAPAIKAT